MDNATIVFVIQFYQNSKWKLLKPKTVRANEDEVKPGGMWEVRLFEH